MKKKPTQSDVARLAGVSRATVSYVINNLEDENAIPVDTSQRVWDAVKKLGYVPNQQAQHLKCQATYRICVILPRLGIPFHDIFLRTLREHATAQGYSVMITIGDTRERIEQLLIQIRGGVADAVYLELGYGTISGVNYILKQLHGIGVPVIVNSDVEPTVDYDVVWDTNEQAAYQAVQHLIERGHQRIAFIGHQIAELNRYERYRGYVQALVDHGIAVDDACIHTGLERLTDAYAVTNELLTSSSPPTAIFCTSDINALMVIAAAQRSGFNIPQDLAVIGSGNITEGAYSYPSLTTIGPQHHTFDDVAHLMMRRLLRGDQPPPKKITREWQLIIRESS